MTQILDYKENAEKPFKLYETFSLSIGPGLFVFTLLIVVTIIVSSYFPFFLPIGIVFAIWAVFSREGTLVDFSGKKIKPYWGPIPIKFGDWLEVHNFDYIEVKQGTYSNSGNTGGFIGASDRSSKNISFKISVFKRGVKRQLLVEYKDPEKAVKVASELAEKLELTCKDFVSADLDKYQDNLKK